MYQSDVLIIGCGIAGCVAALELAAQGVHVVLIGACEKQMSTNSSLAQGGIIGRGPSDSQELLRDDILKAGAGLCHPPAVDLLVQHGPNLVKELLIDKYKVEFDTGPDGSLSYTGEAAHSTHRILFNRDQTGHAIMQALFRAIGQSPLIEFKIGHTAIDLITLSHHSKQET